MARIGAGSKGRQVLGDLGNVGGFVASKKNVELPKHECSGATSPKIEEKKQVTETIFNPRTDMEAREYADDILDHYLRTESLHLAPINYMDTQPELTEEMRAVCLDWIVECASHFHMAPETLFLAVNVLDRFLSLTPIQRKRMQLVSMVSLIIASKYEEIYPPRVQEFIHISADAFAREDMLRYEHSILRKLNYSLTVPTPFSFITRYLLELKPVGEPATSEERKIKYATYFIAECTMLNLELYLEHVPSFLAAAAVHSGRILTGQEQVWPAKLRAICNYDLDEIEALSVTLIRNARTMKSGNLQAIIKKYSDERRSSVAKLI